MKRANHWLAMLCLIGVMVFAQGAQGATVSSINLAGTSPATTGAAVSWTVVFSQSVTGVTASNFALVQTGSVSGASITSISGTGSTRTVNVSAGSGTGTLGLNMVNATGVSSTMSNLTYVGQVYTVFAVFACTPPSNIPNGVAVSCQCDTFQRTTLNPSTIFNSNWVASTSDSTGILPSIVNPGYLRLTNNTGNNAKAVTVPGIFPASGNYISVEFQQYAYNGSGADGMAVILSDYSVPAVPGAYGGSLGYAQETGIHDGFAGGWLGVALDEYGNYQNPTEGRLLGPGFTVESVGARGSGAVQTGYNWLGGTGSLSPKIDNNASTTRSLGYYYQVIVDARNEPTSTTIAVNRDIGSGYTSLINIPNVYTANVTQSPAPTNWQISFTGSTGGSNNIHEFGNLRICAQTMVAPTGGTAGGFNAIDEAYGTPPAVAVQNYLTGHIYTKLVGTPFKLDVAALSNSQILTTYAIASAKTVTVKLVDNSDSLSNSTLDCTLSCTSTCTSKPAVTGGIQTLAFAKGAPDKGQKQSTSFTINSAYQKLVAIMSDNTSPTPTTACSTDSFSVRPLSITSVISTNANNTATTGTPILAAGSGNFSLTATTAGLAGSPSNYTGVLKINSALVTAASPATVSGIVAGTFPAATSATPSSTATGAAFTYSEVGGFTLPIDSVYDGVATTVECTTPGLTTAQCDALKAATWTGVDSISSKSDCVADSFSNTLVAGKYGCNFGNPAAAGSFGRFVPDHFDTVVKYDTGSKLFMSCPTGLTCPASGDLVYGNGFVYSAQPFTTQVTARNAAGATTLNYDSAKSLSKNVTLSAWNAAGGAIANPPGGNGGMVLNSVPSTAFSAGVATTTNTPIYTFTTVPTAPTDIFMRAMDTDGVTSLRAASIEGGLKVVSGRLYIANTYGSQLLPLSINMIAQYWNGTSWVTSTTDSVTNFVVATSPATSAVKFNIYQGPLANVSVVGSPKTVALLNGVGSFNLAAPGSGSNGSVDISVPATTCATTPTLGCYLPGVTGRATFGVYKGSNQFIYQRESY